ncbi:hypothetical protein GCM10018781_28750 [Kitasatospora indigofera]|uniref:Uncharacterized protein n=1 Tax=Kitasatospora indigofera TaxID=67307 RepID=A0A919KRK5_9ACTN|nr:hypothetical protein [Kitasatospora indigofera]GHH69823.1 hypothetical protein GCM10018781_28750 [Kitasatospora indigofera]
MTWMPDRSAAPRSRRRTSRSSQSLVHRSDWADDLGYDGPEHRSSRGGPRQLGIPRIIGRRARWVGARLRRDT